MKEFKFLIQNIEVNKIDYFAVLENFLKSCDVFEDVVVDLTDVNFFDVSLTSIFLSIINYYQQEKAIKINIKVNEKFKNIFQINGLFNNLDCLINIIDENNGKDVNDTYIPLKRFKNGETNYFYDYTESNLRNRHFTDDCLEKITQNLIEIFCNFKDHSGSEYFYISGQYFPHKEEIHVCLTDKGVGLAKYIMSNEKNIENQEDAVEWAFKYGHTTRLNQYGGVGLKYLKNFVEKEKGKLIVYCNNIYYDVLENKTKIFDKEFVGTSIMIVLPNNC